MGQEITKKYCVNTNQVSNHQSPSILCDKCNHNQEAKLNELKKFEATMDVIESFYLTFI